MADRSQPWETHRFVTSEQAARCLRQGQKWKPGVDAHFSVPVPLLLDDTGQSFP